MKSTNLIWCDYSINYFNRVALRLCFQSFLLGLFHAVCLARIVGYFVYQMHLILNHLNRVTSPFCMPFLAFTFCMIMLATFQCTKSMRKSISTTQIQIWTFQLLNFQLLRRHSLNLLQLDQTVDESNSHQPTWLYSALWKSFVRADHA